jgi:hypothetical protein
VLLRNINKTNMEKLQELKDKKKNNNNDIMQN